jgi:hypothetical protein
MRKVFGIGKPRGLQKAWEGFFALILFWCHELVTWITVFRTESKPEESPIRQSANFSVYSSGSENRLFSTGC